MKNIENGTNYTLEVHDHDGEKYIPIDASSDDEARVAAESMAQNNPGAKVFCRFFRKSDEQHGYINQDGADLAGKAY